MGFGPLLVSIPLPECQNSPNPNQIAEQVLQLRAKKSEEEKRKKLSGVHAGSRSVHRPWWR